MLFFLIRFAATQQCTISMPYRSILRCKFRKFRNLEKFQIFQIVYCHLINYCYLILVNALNQELYDGFSWNLKCRCNIRPLHADNIFKNTKLHLIFTDCECFNSKTVPQNFMKLECRCYKRSWGFDNISEKNWCAKLKISAIFHIDH